ncbi:DUF6199 family natural product biosynthesis protein [Gordonia insulae]|uniref:DUF6199 domain-containing protein n=1 Tax=Gordonia insulae TaxID=2420509 RepID=A0A3G8JL99_9ACTN|nr:DUF6199 family natural product biosynthesis protein [Gordonia insulae]AZG44980.1 hypothetical protein D7316_01572 [Gordonia insulae]
MWGFVVLIVLVAVPLLIWQVVSPRGVWRATEAWKFRDPDANEPSDEAYAMKSVGAVMSIIALIVAVVVIASLQTHTGRHAASEPTESSVPYTAPAMPPARDLGPGTMVGYLYPSALTVEFVVLDDTTGYSTMGGCSTVVAVHEHTNAIVVQVGRSQRPGWDGTFRACAEKQVPDVVSRSLTRPVGSRPILTAAPVTAAAEVGLAYGPAVRPTPLDEYPRPGVVRALTPVRIDPTWRSVPLLAELPRKN